MHNLKSENILKYKALFFIAALILCAGLLNAQSDFRPGFIVKNTGDTVYGEIDYRGDLLMSSVCRFKDADNNINNYPPSDISAYRFVDSRHFISREIDGSYVFLEYLVNGRVSIFFMRDDEGDHFFIEKEGKDLIRIPYEEGIRYVNDKPLYHKSTSHLRLLNYYMQDAPGIESRINSIKKPERRNLVKLAERYHHLIGKEESYVIYDHKRPLTRVAIESFAGVIKYRGYDHISDFGGNLYFWAPTINENVFVKTGLHHHKVNTEDEKFSVIKVPIQLQYIYRLNRVQPEISYGINILNANNSEFMMYTLSLNGGLLFKISNSVRFSTRFNSEYTPLFVAAVDSDTSFNIMAYSFTMGLRFDL